MNVLLAPLKRTLHNLGFHQKDLYITSGKWIRCAFCRQNFIPEHQVWVNDDNVYLFCEQRQQQKGGI